MFIIELIYKVPLEEIDAHMKAHIKFLDKYYQSGNFIVSGQKVSREGGIIIAAAKDKISIQKIIKEDPFYKYKLADYRITEFLASQQSQIIKEVLKQL